MQQENAATNVDIWRLFAAIELPPDVHQRIQQVMQHLRSVGWSARWVRPESSHLTLKFYGDVPRQRLHELSAALRRATGTVPVFDLRTDGPGVFPTPKRPRVLWLGVSEPTGRLQALYEAVEDASVQLGFEPEGRDYHPHLTVARFRPGEQPTVEELTARFAELSRLPEIEFPVTTLALYRSELSRDGAKYTVIGRFDLAEFK